MGRFILEAGEQVAHRERVRTLGERDQLTVGELVLTDRRVVLVAEPGDPRTRGGGILGAIFSSLLRPPAITHQIRREAFATAEVTNETELLVRSKGEGYALIWFSVVTKTANAWADQLHRWAAGVSTAAELPPARLVDR